jgi:hypothetical protein
MKRYVFGFLALLLFGCSAQQTSSSDQSEVSASTNEPALPKVASLPDLGPAPELTNDTWLNVDSPLRIADLQGKVVIGLE